LFSLLGSVTAQHPGHAGLLRIGLPQQRNPISQAGRSPEPVERRAARLTRQALCALIRIHNQRNSDIASSRNATMWPNAARCGQ
jgi:hypothetical protein